LEAWAGVQTVAMVASMRLTDEGRSEKGFYISSLEWDSEKLLQAIYAYWEIENRLHWCPDVGFHEDACRTRTN